MREYFQYFWTCIVIAWQGSVQNASNWAGVVGLGLVGIVLWFLGVKLPSVEWPWDLVIALGYFLVAWVVIFVFRLIFVAPYQLYRKYLRPHALDQLNKFYVEIEPLIKRNIPKNDPVALEAHFEATKGWLNATAKWIGDNLGDAARAKFLDTTGMIYASVQGAVNERHNSLLLQLMQYRQNLSALIERDVWR